MNGLSFGMKPCVLDSNNSRLNFALRPSACVLQHSASSLAPSQANCYAMEGPGQVHSSGRCLEAAGGSSPHPVAIHTQVQREPEPCSLPSHLLPKKRLPRRFEPRAQHTIQKTSKKIFKNWMGPKRLRAQSRPEKRGYVSQELTGKKCCTGTTAVLETSSQRWGTREVSQPWEQVLHPAAAVHRRGYTQPHENTAVQPRSAPLAIRGQSEQQRQTPPLLTSCTSRARLQEDGGALTVPPLYLTASVRARQFHHTEG